MEIGARLGPYEILAPIGAGGMGEVYKARDTRLGRDVAIKVLPAEYASDPERLRRFEQEARAVAALSHPNVLAIFDVGTHEGSPYLVTELLEGESLRERLQAGPLTPRKAVEVGAEIAQGLAAAHEKGIIHRDLKPANVFVRRDGQVKILDFGLAKLTHPETPLDPYAKTVDGEPSTESGAVLGTMGYTSPEQLRGERADARSDLFSFGCVLYEMLAGKSPFLKRTGAETVTAIMSEDPAPLSGTGREIAPAVQEIVSRCLEKRAEERFSSAHDLALALRAYSGGSETAATVKGPARVLGIRRSWLIGAAAVGLLAVAAAVLFWAPWRRAAPAASLDPKRIVVAVFENRTGDPSLDPLGREAAESVIDGLSKVTTLKVVPSSTVLPASAGGADAASTRDPVHALAESAGAGTVVSGAYSLEGPTLQVRAKVTDVMAGKLLWPIDPASAPREKAGEAVETIRQRLLDAVAARCLVEGLDLLVWEGRPPRYEAIAEFVKGWDLFGSDMPAALAHFRRAIDLDPGFLRPHIAIAALLDNMGRFADADAELDRLEAMKDEMTPPLRRHFDWIRADVAGRFEECYSISVEEFAHFPEAAAENLAVDANYTNRPLTAIATLRKPLNWEAGLTSANPMGLIYFMEMTSSLHQLGKHEEELKEAQRGRGIYADLLNAWAYEARALVALGRLDDVDRLVDKVLSMPPRWGYESCCMPRGTPGLVMLAAAEELRAHGHREASVKMASRAADWYRSRTGDEAKRADNRARHGEALYMAERWPEAKAVFASLAAEKPAYVNAKGWLGAIAARQGDSIEARRISAELGALNPKYLFGIDALWQAQIAAILGDKDGAVAFLHESVARGYGWSKEREVYGYGFLYPHLMDLESLHGYPPFEELVKPKG